MSVAKSDFSPAQHSLLSSLEAQTREHGGRFFVERWANAGTVYRLDVRVPSGATEGASLEEHATTFVATYADLWKLSFPEQLKFVGVVEGGDCSRVVLQRFDEGVPVFNATLTVSLTESGIVRSVVGRMSGVELLPAGEVLAKKAALDAYGGEFGASSAEGLEPTQVIYSSLFAGGLHNETLLAWIFHGSDERGLPNATYPVVIGRDGPPLFSGPTFNASLVTEKPFTCEDADATAWSALVVLDPLTRTPAWMNFAHFGGIKVKGATDEERAYALASLPPMQRAFGSVAPRAHLRDARTSPLDGGRRMVTFQQYYAGVPVDGAYLSVVFGANSRVESVFARFVYAPHTETTPTVSASDAIAGATAAAKLQLCGDDAGCIQAYDQALLESPAAAQLVIVSGDIFEDSPFENAHRLAWRVTEPHYLAHWDARSSKLLRGTPTARHLLSGKHRTYSPSPGVKLDCNGSPHHCGIEDGSDPVPLGYVLKSDNGTLLGSSDSRVLDVEVWLLGIDALFTNDLDHPALSSAPADKDGVQLRVYMDSADPGNAYMLASRPMILALGSDVTTDDIVAHEYVHAAVTTIVDLDHVLEPGATDEFLADLFAVTAFPASDGGWSLGEDAVGGATRNLKEPWLHAGYAWHTSLKAVACPSGDFTCRHVWMGIPSRAAALIADGRPDGGTAFSRLGASALFLSAAKRLQPSDRFLNLRVKVADACAAFTTPGSAAPVKLTDEHCTWAAEAFDLVGVTEVVRSGFDRFPSGYYAANETFTLHEGRQIFNGCVLKDHRITAQVTWRNGYSYAVEVSADSTAPVPHRVEYPPQSAEPEFIAAITRRGPPDAPSLREVTYTVEARWLRERSYVFVDEVLDKGANASVTACIAPAGTIEQELWSPLRKFEQGFVPFDATATSFYGFGRRIEVPVNPAAAGPCTVLAVGGVHTHPRDAFAPPIRRMVDHGHHGYTVSSPWVGTNMLGATLSAWYNGDSALYARVAYIVARPQNEPDGFCTVPGAAMPAVRP